MKTKIKFIAPIALTVFFVFALAYGINTKFESILSIFSPSITDTTDTPPGNFKDVSQMFNERGLYKSSGYSLDESEIINDFNGNLMYEIPLYNYKLPGDLNLDIKLVYNSSVGHQINFGKESELNNNVTYYNMNFPEWIISLKGIAVQVFNFETEFYTRPEPDNVVEQSAINPLIPGYHFDDRLISVNGTDRDRIKILTGDGSLITLVNKSWQTSGSDAERYTGIYHTEEKESYMWAKVYFYETATENSYRNRIVELMMGDGSVFVFKEYKRDFYDLRLNSEFLSDPNRPQMLLLEKIIDRFGNNIFLGYEFNSAPNSMGLTLYGRPLLKGITNDITGLAGRKMDISLIYAGNMAKIQNSSEINGNYLFRFFNAAYYTQGGLNNLAFINKIVNPLFQEATFTPQAENKYVRILDEVPNPTAIGGNYQDIKFNNLLRLDSVRTFLKSKKVYSYYPSNVNNITITFPQTTLNSTYHRGYGRDPFYSNMILSKNDFDEKTVSKSTSTYDYYFNDAGTGFSTLPVDDNDLYSTTKYITSNDENTINNTPNQLKTAREYKVFPSRYEVTGTQTEVQNYNGITKLIKEQEIDVSDSSVYLTNDYEYNTGTNGSFLMTEKTNTMKGISRTWQWTYEYVGSNTDSVISKKTETDPNDNIMQTEVTYNFKELSFYKGSGSHIFYNYNIPTKDYRYTGASKTYEKTYEYFNDTANDNKGFYGQLKTEKIHNNSNFSQYIETKYEYYKLDTTGKHLYLSGGFPYIEGNLKLIIKPDGQIEKYYYHPVSSTEDKIPGQQEEIDAPPEPYVSYKIKYNNGTIAVKKAQLKDTRLPIRIDNLKLSGSTYDTLKKQYFEYNGAGYPIKVINENNFLTELVYQPTHRISSITLPGDFSTEQSYDSVYYNDTYIDTILVIPGVGWGNLNINNNALTVTPSSVYVGQCAYFRLLYDNLYGTKQAAFVKFNFNNVFNLADIDSAMFYAAPHIYTCHVNGEQVDPSYFNVSLKAVYSSTSPSYTSCADNVENSTASINSYTITTDINADNQTNNCYFYPHYMNIKAILEDLRSNSRNLYGIFIQPQLYNLPINEGDRVQFLMDFTECNNFSAPYWSMYFAPKITVYGHYLDRDTMTIRVVKGSTYYYRYDDINNTITTHSRLTHSPAVLKKVKYYIDGFGNVKQKNILVNNNDSNRFFYKYNYLLKLAADIDATNDTTWHSYDLLGRDSIVQHQDKSSGSNGNKYLNSLQTAFYNLSGKFIEKQTFTDETGRYFNKYFDAVGNLLREEKFVAGDGNGNIEDSDTPFDPDTTYEGQDTPSEMIQLITDYKYDNLYRLIQVKTPGNKDIFYYYDGYGRQVQRRTTDAGNTYYSYDNNNNLILSQDANQRAVDSRLHTRRYYDALNRLLTIGDIKIGAPIGGGNGPMGDTTLPFEFDSPLPADSLYIINVYDTISYASVANVFTELPSGYSTPNYTKGQLVATAYRTILGNSWNFKYYRYDQRGNLVKMWHKIDGLGWKVIDNIYNSQNLAVRLSYQAGQGDGKVFTYGYDDAGRLQYTNLYVGTNPGSPEEETDYPSLYLTMASYTYNPDQQVLTSSVNVSNPYTMTNAYNNRNWLKQSFKSAGVFGYTLQYIANGNIRFQNCFGTYTNNFGNQSVLRYTYIYDNSNRLVKADRDSGEVSTSFDIINNYDKDGNFVSMKRYGSSNNLVDNFSYTYFSGTNRLQSIGSGNNYTYDANGNVTDDDKNRNDNYKYDWRNLLTEIRSIKTENGLMGPEDVSYWTLYNYDEAGNRMRKLNYKYVIGEPPGGHEDAQPGDTIVIDQGDGNGYWVFQSRTFYVRDAAGKEIAIYTGTSIEQWNIYGLDNVGKINSDNKRYFYLKDHLGSVRAVLDTTNTVVSAQDYDPWGYPLENRTWLTNNTKYKFTGKEHDNENNYDYFGARYYDSRIGRWGGVEPLYDKYINISPYIYTLNNPLILFDGNGLDVYITGKNNEDLVKNIQAETRNLNLSIDKETGKLTVTQLNNVLTTAETTLLEASNNSNIDVKLNITEENYFEQNGQKQYFAVGGYGGYLIDANGKIVAAQYFNIEHAELYEKHGGSSVGYSALHEIIESYIGNNLPVEFLNPNHDNTNQIINIDMLNAHKQTVNMLPDPDDSPSIKFRIDAAGSKSAYLYKNNGKIVKIY